MKQKKQIKRAVITAKLVFFDWGWEDNILYRQRAKVNEKEKGIQMISKLKEYFGITNKDIKESEDITITHEIQRIKWTRDDKGNIVSPFATRKKK